MEPWVLPRAAPVPRSPRAPIHTAIRVPTIGPLSSPSPSPSSPSSASSTIASSSLSSMPRAALQTLNDTVIACRRCPRLVAWREEIARVKRSAFRDEEYWGRPIVGFGDPKARMLIVGLAPAAHGGNRTGRVFTGDRSGDFLYAALHRAGFANQPTSTHKRDGLRLTDCYITACVRCAPPDNKPTPQERDTCLEYLQTELPLLKNVRVILCLGGFAWDGVLRVLATLGHAAKPRPAFGHAAEATVGPYRLLGCYHPSQQNSFTGRLTPKMLDAVLARARRLWTAAFTFSVRSGRTAPARS